LPRPQTNALIASLLAGRKHAY